jgi:predicted secreted protein
MTRFCLLLLTLLLGLAWLTSGWTGQPGATKQQSRRVKVFTINDNGKEIRIRQGELFRVELESPGATGYLWQVEDLDRSRLDLVNHSTRVLLSDGRMGAPVVSVFKFRAISGGSVNLTIDYYRPWEGRAKSERTFCVKINIV